MVGRNVNALQTHLCKKGAETETLRDAPCWPVNQPRKCTEKTVLLAVQSDRWTRSENARIKPCSSRTTNRIRHEACGLTTQFLVVVIYTLLSKQKFKKKSQVFSVLFVSVSNASIRKIPMFFGCQKWPGGPDPCCKSDLELFGRHLCEFGHRC